MAQEGNYTAIKCYASETASAVPAAERMEVGEIAINIADAKIYTKNSSAEIVELSGGNNHTHTAEDITDFTLAVTTILTDNGLI